MRASRCWPSEWKTPQWPDTTCRRECEGRLRGQAASCQYSKQLHQRKRCRRPHHWTGLTLISSKVYSGSPTNHSAWREPCCLWSPRRQQRHQCHNWTRAALSTHSRANTRRCLDRRSPSPTWGTTLLLWETRPWEVPIAPDEDKAFGHTCSRCGKANHSDKVCKSKLTPTKECRF